MGIHTLDIKALMPKCGRFALLIASATLISACSSTPTVQDDTDQTTFEPQTGSIEPTASPAAEDHSNDKHAIQLAENHPREYIVKKVLARNMAT